MEKLTPEEYLEKYGNPPPIGVENTQHIADYKMGFQSGVELGEDSRLKDEPYHSWQRKGWELGLRYRANHGDS